MRHSVHRVKIMVEKVPEFSAEFLCLHQGITKFHPLIMVDKIPP